MKVAAGLCLGFARLHCDLPQGMHLVMLKLTCAMQAVLSRDESRVPHAAVFLSGSKNDCVSWSWSGWCIILCTRMARLCAGVL